MSTTGTDAELKKTAFHPFHVAQSAKMVDFTGWEMPLHYGSIIEEHRQVRRSGGLFDVSHMGRLVFSGKDACRFLDRVCTRQVHGMTDGQARYGLICNEQGGCRDDVLVYRVGENDYRMVCNAANREKLLDHFAEVRGDLVFKLEDITMDSAMLAMQGAKVMELIGKYSTEIPQLKRYRFVVKNLFGLKMLISRTGYTGEDGVEVIFRTDNAIARTATAMLTREFASLENVIKPAGLGARDSLRLEASMALYGHEITEEIDPISAGLNFAVKLDKGDDDPSVERFIGQDALRKIAEEGPRRKLVGLTLDSKRSARQGMAVKRNGDEVGVVTSGCLSPTLEKSIAMAYVDAEHAGEGTTLEVDLGRQAIEALVVSMPFYKAR